MRPRHGALLPAVVLLLGVTTSCSGGLRSFAIPSGAMENTLRVGDHIGVKEGAEVERGSIVVFVGPASWQLTPEGGGDAKFVKRVIGLGGDHVVCCDRSGRITVNGHPLDEPYLYPSTHPSDTNFDVTVPNGRLWVMGDHRNASADSRSHITDGYDGTIPLGNVIGVAVKILAPEEHARPLVTPGYDLR